MIILPLLLQNIPSAILLTLGNKVVCIDPWQQNCIVLTLGNKVVLTLGNKVVLYCFYHDSRRLLSVIVLMLLLWHAILSDTCRWSCCCCEHSDTAGPFGDRVAVHCRLFRLSCCCTSQALLVIVLLHIACSFGDRVAVHCMLFW